MKSFSKPIFFILTLSACFVFLFLDLAVSDQESSNISPEDRIFLENIVSALQELPGTFESRPGPYVYMGPEKGMKRVTILVFSGRRSVFVKLGKVLDKHPEVSQGVISNLVECLDQMKPSSTSLKGKPVPLGVMCYEALSSICYYEAFDKDGGITEWEGTVLPDATESDLQSSKKAWEIIVNERAYIRL